MTRIWLGLNHPKINYSIQTPHLNSDMTLKDQKDQKSEITPIHHFPQQDGRELINKRAKSFFTVLPQPNLLLINSQQSLGTTIQID